MLLSYRLDGSSLIAAGKLVDQADAPPHKGLLLRAMTRFVQALQDARQREADRHHAHYQELTRGIGR
jgi:hypothetical protein